MDIKGIPNSSVKKRSILTKNKPEASNTTNKPKCSKRNIEKIKSVTQWDQKTHSRHQKSVPVNEVREKNTQQNSKISYSVSNQQIKKQTFSINLSNRKDTVKILCKENVTNIQPINLSRKGKEYKREVTNPPMQNYLTKEQKKNVTMYNKYNTTAPKANSNNCSQISKGLDKKTTPINHVCTSYKIDTIKPFCNKHDSINQKINKDYSPDKSFNQKPILLPLSCEHLFQDIKDLVKKAKWDRKTFTVIGNFSPIRKALIERGWIEKLRISLREDNDQLRYLELLPMVDLILGMKISDLDDRYRKVLISKLLASHQVDFYWDCQTNPFTVNSDKVKQTIINRYPSHFTRTYEDKGSLCLMLNTNAHWFNIDGLSKILYPRTYNLAYEYEKKAFTEDFQLTAAISLLKWILTTENDDNFILISRSGNIPACIFRFAIVQCKNYLKTCLHRDIDECIPETKSYEWNTFLDSYYKMTQKLGHFHESDHFTKEGMIQESKVMLKQLQRFCPDLEHDGNLNLWIIKPHHGTQGCGILIWRSLKYILNYVKSDKFRRYIVQKYIERPMLIYETKFDIRQWFLISHQPTLHVWMYRDCYLRFSSQNFDLYNLHESVHLTNNAIQRKYKNGSRNPALPIHNMWHSVTFRRYLIDIGQPLAWKNIIYKGMKECLIGLIMCCQESMSHRVNSFELWGTDFIVRQDFQPVLLEVNSTPALSPSTSVTAELCPQVLEDIIKVIVDYGKDAQSSTGRFDLIYKDDKNTDYNEQKKKSLTVLGMNYFSKYKTFKPSKHRQKTPDKKSREKCKSPSLIKDILDLDADQVKANVKSTLEKILMPVQDNIDTINDANKDKNPSQLFKDLLAEFVSIISTPSINSPVGP